MKTIRNYSGEQVGSTIHEFERAGLGKAPFKFVGVAEKTYQACQGAPVQPGGTCAYCGQAIRYCFGIRSADGKRFVVGSDCVDKTNDAGLRRVVDAKVNELKRTAQHARQDALIAQATAALPQAEAALRAIPHPQEYRASKGETKLDQVVWYLQNAGRSGKCWAAKEILGFVQP
jgi:hypothetical protein